MVYFEHNDGGGSIVGHFAEVISVASHLTELHLRNAPRLDEGVAREALSTALKDCSNLRHVSMYNAEEGVVDVLAVCIATRASSGSSPFLEKLSLEYGDLAGETLARLACSNITVIEISSIRTLYDFYLEQWKGLGRGLLQPLALQRLQITFDTSASSEKQLEALENGLEELLNAIQRSSALVLCIYTFRANNASLLFLQKAVTDTYLTTVTLDHVDVSSPNFKSFVEKLGENTSVRNFTLSDCQSSAGDGWEHFFLHLRRNASIRNLKFGGCGDLSDDYFRDLMEVLQVNLTVQRVDISRTQWTRDGKTALVEEALKRNRS